MKNDTDLNTELYELKIPGKIIGKEVIDSNAKRIGIVRNLKLEFLPLKIFLIVKSIGIELKIPFDYVQAIGTVIKLKNIIKNAEEIDIESVLRLREEISAELRISLSNI